MSVERVPVAVLGGSGYTAVELLKILLRHPGVSIAAARSSKSRSPDARDRRRCRSIGANGVRFTTFLAQVLADARGLLEAVP